MYLINNSTPSRITELEDHPAWRSILDGMRYCSHQKQLSPDYQCYITICYLHLIKQYVMQFWKTCHMSHMEILQKSQN